MNRKTRILVVDDDPSYRQLLTYQLTRAGYEVLLARDGRQALDWFGLNPHRPDLVILDLLMPQLSGMEVLELIRTLPDKPPVILLSGAEPPIVRQGINWAKPDAFLAKPFEWSSLLEKIETLLRSVSESE